MSLIETLEQDAMNMNDKFFHGVGCYVDYGYGNEKLTRSERLSRLRSILMKGCLRTLEPGGKVFLSIYPFGDYSKIYTGDSQTRELIGGFEMSNQSFYLILGPEVQKEPNITPGVFCHECTFPSPFPVSNHIVGIGRVGNGIYHDVIISYIFTKYINGEISIEEVIKFFRRTYASWINNTPEDSYRDYYVRRMIEHFLIVDRNPLELTISMTRENLIDIGFFNEIRKILDELSINIELYDCYGYLLNPERSLEIAEEMQEYVREKRCNFETYSKELKKLRENIKHKQI